MKIRTMLDHLRRAQDVMQSVHEELRDDVLFAAGDQWMGTEGDRSARGETSYTFNRAPALINPVVNSIKQAPPAIRVIPLGGEATVEICTLTASRIRLLENQCNASRARMVALNSAVTGGFGCWRTIPKKINGTWRPVSESIVAPEDVFPDANSIEPDFSDAQRVFHKKKFSKRALVDAFPDSDWSDRQRIPEDDCDTASDIVDGYEHWYLEGGKLKRALIVGESLVGEDEFGADELGWLSKLPYSFVVGSYHRDEDGTRHYAGVLRYAKADQLAINLSENAWIGDMETRLRARYMVQADALEDNEDEFVEASRRRLPYVTVKDISKVTPITQPDVGSGYQALSATHEHAMQQIAGVGFNTGATIDPVSGKSVKLQQSQAAVATYHFADSLNQAVAHDGQVYLDQLRVYEADGTIRAVLLEDGRTIERAAFGTAEGMELVPDVMRVDLSRGEYGIQISTGPSYGSQLEQMQDLIAELIRSPALAGSAPLLTSLLLKRMAIPESEDIIDALLLTLPPQVQQIMAAKGNKSAIMAQTMSQNQQLQAQMKELTQKLQACEQALQQAQQTIQTKQATAQQDNQAKLAQEDMRSRNDQFVQHQREQHDIRMAAINADAKIAEQYAGEQAKMFPQAPGMVTPQSYDAATGQVDQTMNPFFEMMG